MTNEESGLSNKKQGRAINKIFSEDNTIKLYATIGTATWALTIGAGIAGSIITRSIGPYIAFLFLSIFPAFTIMASAILKNSNEVRELKTIILNGGRK